MKPTPRPRFRRGIPPPTPPSLSEHELLAIRQAGFQEALFQAWFATGLEQTKSVFALASAGVGLSLTLIFSDTTKSVESWATAWLLLAIMAFAVSAVFCIWVFRINGRLVAKLLKDEDHAAEDGLVGRVDRASRILFGAGIAFLLFAAIAQIWL